MCQGLSSISSHYFHIIGDGHQPNSSGFYTHYKEFLLFRWDDHPQYMEFRPWHMCDLTLQSFFKTNARGKLVVLGLFCRLDLFSRDFLRKTSICWLIYLLMSP